MIPDKATLAEWRDLAAGAMVSAVGEYTPAEFTVLLDAVDELLETVRVLEGVQKTLEADTVKKVDQLCRLREAAELVMGDWPNFKVRDYLRAVLNWIEFGHEIRPESYPYRKGGEGQ